MKKLSLQLPQFSGLTASKLIDHILNTYHKRLKFDLPGLHQLFLIISGTNRQKVKHFDPLWDNYLELEKELYQHVSQEEEILFPLIRQLDRPLHKSQLIDIARKESLWGSVNQMEYEHNKTFIKLREIENLTEYFSPPSDAPQKVKTLFTMLEEFSLDLQEHILFENEYLHPLALRL